MDKKKCSKFFSDASDFSYIEEEIIKPRKRIPKKPFVSEEENTVKKKLI